MLFSGIYDRKINRLHTVNWTKKKRESDQIVGSDGCLKCAVCLLLLKQKEASGLSE